MLSKQITRAVLSLPAATVTDGVHEVYISAHSYNYHNFQILWTAGIAGTLSCKIYGAVQDTDSTGVTNTYEDLTQLLYNAPDIQDSTMLLNNSKYLGLVSWIKIECTIGSSDPTTALMIYYKSKDL